ncbi:MAG: ABC transporter substrate-binding protein [Cetobacterium sp.]|uniref:ABC transporter substrate-binding protein n=2 Tax=Cetobacterium sp. TaxID=2071632 RepID=UPI003EE6463F
MLFKSKFLKVLVLTTSLCFTTTLFSQENKTQKILITDNVERAVQLSVPVKKAVVISRYNNELIRACGAIDNVVAVDMNTAQDRVYWSKFKVEDVIGKNQNDLNYEKIISLSPEVVIIPANGAYKEAEKKLEPFGIKVIVISGYDTNDFHNQIKNIGAIFGKEIESKKFIQFYEKPLKYIEEKLQNVEKKSVYWEDSKNYYTAFPGSYYYNMVKASGGKNIFGELDRKTSEAQVDSESIIIKNPSVIVKNISPAQAIKGTGVYEAPKIDQQLKTIEDIKHRKGWKDIDAVKNNNIFLMSQFGHGGASKMIGAAYMAKWIYPEVLSDLDPDALFKEWLEEFQGFQNIEGHFYPSPNKRS